MAYTTINKSTDYFNTKLYTGTGSSNALTGVGFQPDWVWFKGRNQSYHHYLFDAVRGVNKPIHSSLANVQSTQTDTLMSFDSDGFTLGSDSNNGEMNSSGNTFTSWSWKAGAGQGSSNTAGSINTTYTSVNTTAGFSISQYTGNQTSGASVGHGLGAVPKMILVKSLSEAHAWRVYHKSVGATKELYLNLNNAAYTTSNIWNDQEPTSSVFYLGNNDTGTNKSGVTYVAYCFADKTGYSKFGSYVGNGNADGTFVYTGFKPAFVLLKQTNEARDWLMMDNKRLGYNANNYDLHPNGSDVEDNNPRLDLLSNGFKQKATSSANNKSGATYIYMAFAEAPLVGSNNVPCTAR